ncbi:MAG: pantetheine-phosphate adenylyltransferase [Candidatus Bathyarchaeota archaeon]|nr:MAG: pantetheine-phosphate adenylyltransferase [Candidatus Bathyarchaeota archaeon]
MRKNRLVAVGGTFDEFHRGHKALLLQAFEAGERVLIGLSTDSFAERMQKTHEITPFAVRYEELKSFLRKQGWVERAEIVALHDSYGVAATSKDIEAIVVSEETESVASEINAERRKRKLQPLRIIVVRMILAENSNPISTTRIRHFEIDREGRLLKPEDKQHTCRNKSEEKSS